MKNNWSVITWGVGILVVIGITYGDARSRIIALEKAQFNLETKYDMIMLKQDKLLERLTSIEVKLEERTSK